jgi:hypothetical protein
MLPCPGSRQTCMLCKLSQPHIELEGVHCICMQLLCTLLMPEHSMVPSHQLQLLQACRHRLRPQLHPTLLQLLPGAPEQVLVGAQHWHCRCPVLLHSRLEVWIAHTAADCCTCCRHRWPGWPQPPGWWSRCSVFVWCGCMGVWVRCSPAQPRSCMPCAQRTWLISHYDDACLPQMAW